MSEEPRILIITTTSCSYPGVDNAGQKHLEYSPHSYVLNVPDPVMFPISFYLKAFDLGYDGIFIASCGTDSPFRKTYDKLSARIDELVKEMKKLGIHYSRVKLTAICTVCADHFVKELKEFSETIATLPITEVPAVESAGMESS